MSEPMFDEKQEARDPTNRQGKLLLVCEDAKDLGDFCTRLKQHGYETSCSSSYAEGASSVDQQAFDLVIVSQGSPAFEGREVLERAIERDRGTRVLVITRTIDMSSYLEAMQLGAADYLEKPTTPPDILGLVRMHLRPTLRAARPVSSQ